MATYVVIRDVPQPLPMDWKYMNHRELFQEIDRLFLTEASISRVRAFRSAECQVEGWFKGELLLRFSELQQQQCVSRWQRECQAPNIGNGKIDFSLDLDDGPLYIELKAFYHGNQRGANVPLNTCFYFLSGDIDKLLDIGNGNRYSIIFVIPRPTHQQWSTCMDRFSRRHPCVSEERTRDDFPEELFIAKLRVQNNGNGG